MAMHRNNPRAASIDAELELDCLIEFLGALSALTELGGPADMAQLSANQLHGMFHTISAQAERVRAAM